MNLQDLEQKKKIKLLTSEILKCESNLHIYAYKFFKSKQNREDLVQDTLIKALKAIDKYDENKGAVINSWLYQIMKFTAIDIFRTRKFKLSNDNVSIDNLKTQNSYSDNIELKIDMQHYLKRINAIKNDKKRTIFKMYLEGYLYIEIAETTNTKLNTVKGVIRRTRLEIGR